MATIDFVKIQRQIAQDTGLTNSKLKTEAAKRVTTIFNDAVIGMQKEFEENKITQEIDAGITSSNISNTLNGGEAPTNLTSFIGFPNGSTPTEPIRDALDPSNPDGPKIGPAIKVLNGNQPTYEFTIKAPNLNNIYKKTPLPWAAGMSWAEKIETGIPGFAQFLARYTKTDNSRSGGGIQTKNDIRSADFIPPEGGYLTKIFSNFLESVKNFTRQKYRR